VRPFIELLRERGLGIESPAIGPGSVSLDDPDARIPHVAAMSLLSVAVRGTGDPALGLHAAEKIRPGDFDVLEFAARSSGTLGEALATVFRYLRLLHDTADFALEPEGDHHVIRFRLTGGLALPPAAAELVVATLVVVGRRIAGADLVPVEARFVHPAPPDTSEYSRVFRCPVRFDASDNALAIPTSHLTLPMPAADPTLKAFLDKTARQLLEKLPPPGENSWGERVEQVLVTNLRGGEPSLEGIARELGVSSRTLRRRLQEEGTQYRHLLDALRSSLARRYLAENRLSIADVSFLIGFSEPSAFHKAFKRWTGRSPAEFRRR
jgi:AraC-like DNA-binding protein